MWPVAAAERKAGSAGRAVGWGGTCTDCPGGARVWAGDEGLPAGAVGGFVPGSSVSLWILAGNYVLCASNNKVCGGEILITSDGSKAGEFRLCRSAVTRLDEQRGKWHKV